MIAGMNDILSTLSLKWELGFVHYITKFTILRFVISRFECTQIVMVTNHARKNIHYYYIHSYMKHTTNFDPDTQFQNQSGEEEEENNNYY